MELPSNSGGRLQLKAGAEGGAKVVNLETNEELELVGFLDIGEFHFLSHC
jgi:hypothetical protein